MACSYEEGSVTAELPHNDTPRQAFRGNSTLVPENLFDGADVFRLGHRGE
jgi:hypothetical protein